MEFEAEKALLGGEVVLSDELQRFVGYDKVTAVLAFSSKDSARSFAEGMRLEISYHGSEAEGVMDDLRTGKDHLWLSYISAQELLRFLEDTDHGQEYIALDPDTPKQQVWDIEVFEDHLKLSQ